MSTDDKNEDGYIETGAEIAARLRKQSTEFRTLAEMTPEELVMERKQIWLIKKSDCAWWIHRNHAAFMPCHSEARAIEILEQYGITGYAIDRTQRPATEKDWAEFRRDKMRLLGGKGPSVARRVWRWLGGDAA
jgi:hypothetical protein